MKKILHAIFILTLLFSLSSKIFGQCKGFAKNMCKIELVPYIHDGNYHAAILNEGEEAELYKTFYSGQSYRIAVCCTDQFSHIEFQVVDAYKKVLFDNTEHNNVTIWDFSLESSQQLKISVKVPDSGEEYPKSGCVAIMFGFKEKKETRLNN